ncbi:hypothetical protein EJ04DRAFT_591893 [Polyplosphaeria fusca]|uniref:Ubiquitin-like protease family profile domain-containing protein n=1 Tax=Polyplosphaeria fusca TaxID=682080 RepID=A0A9P4QNQ2_9PLEO|nr:hypothetical protein EJ04DRAFT_591893 [Polyplosphaeria fusca]
MAPGVLRGKRAATKFSNERRIKKPKAASREPKDTRRRIQWVLPRYQNESVETNIKSQFAPVLFGTPWNDVVNVQHHVLLPSPIPSPASALSAASEDRLTTLNERQSPLGSFYFAVYNDLHNSDEGIQLGPTFELSRGDTAVIATTPPYKALGGSYPYSVIPEVVYTDVFTDLRLTVLSRSLCETPHLNRSFDLIRAVGHDGRDTAFFVKVPPGHSIAINGQTYTAESRHGFLIIGPLDDFTVMESLNEPIFFWRKAEDLMYTKDRYASKEPLQRIQPDSSVHSGRTKVLLRSVFEAESVNDTLPTTWTNDEVFFNHTAQAWLDRQLRNLQPSQPDTLEVKLLNSDQLSRLIASVLLSINNRRRTQSDFSFLADDGCIARPGETLLLPLIFDDYAILLVHRPQKITAQRTTIVDSVTWRWSKEDRKSICETIGHNLSNFHMDHSTGNTSYKWYSSAQHWNKVGSKIYTILNAWALGMGLELERGRVIDDELFQNQAAQLFNIALKRRLDWKTLLAFFHSHGFVTDRSLEPPKDRRFDQQQEPNLYIRYSSQTPPALLLPIIEKSHEDSFPSDHWDFRIRHQAVPALLRDNMLDWTCPTEKIRRQYISQYGSMDSPRILFRGKSPSPVLEEAESVEDLAVPRLQTPELPDKFDACKYFRQQMAEDVDTWAFSLRDTNSESAKNNTPGIKRFLPSDDAIFESIASVCLAINDRQPAEQGFSALSLESWKGLLSSSSDVDNVVRPNRLLLLPWKTNAHWLLIAIQTEFEAKEISIHAIDSAQWMNNEQQRTEIFQQVKAFISDIGWNTFEDCVLPDTMTWEYCAQQSAQWEGAYYTILHAWTIYLGYQSNPGFSPGKNFYRDARDFFQLASQGHISWVKLLAFLLCTGFVDADYQPDHLCKFAKTVSRFKLSEILAKLRDEDTGVLPTSLGPDSFETNHQFDPAYVHSDHQPCDEWADIRPTLQRAGFFNSMAGTIPQRKRYTDMFNEPVQTPVSKSRMMKELQNRGEGRFGSSDEEVINRFAEATRVTSRSQCVPINLDPSRYLSQRLSLYSKSPYPTLTRLPPPNSLEQMALAISSVTEAIIRLQDDPENLGGFALASPTLLVKVIKDKTLRGSIARPRRAWLMPCKVQIKPVQVDADGRPRTDTVLAVLQEEKLESSPCFKIYILDSKPDQLKKHTDIIKRVQSIAERMGWTAHRNKDKQVGFTTFDPENDVKSSAVQGAENPDSSPLHVILNAWICALGLTPVGGIEINAQSYRQLLDLIQYALCGYADWTTIAAFLVCKKIVHEKAVHAVPGDRRFARTVKQADARALQARVEDLVEEDLYVEKYMEDTSLFPYDTRNNVLFTPSREGMDDKDGFTHIETTFKSLTGGSKEEFCKYFSSTIRKNARDQQQSAWLKEIKTKDPDYGGVTSKFGEFTSQSEIVLGIASVTLAITKTQSLRAGLSILSEYQYGAECEVLRFGRPLIMPFSELGNHHVLIVAQFDRFNKPTVSVVDSRPWHLDRNARRSLAKMVLERLGRINWGRNVLPKGGLPQKLTWISSAHQPNQWMCGYYAMLNAWALALGLRLNTDFKPQDERKFFIEATNTIHLARGGFVDWRLITAWFRCIGFVQETESSLPRAKFAATQRLDDSDSFHFQIDGMKIIEDSYWESERNPSYEDVTHYSHIPLPQGVDHDANLPSDSWDDYYRLIVLMEFEPEGKFNANDSKVVTRTRYILERGYHNREALFGGFLSHLRNNDKEAKDLAWEDLLDEYFAWLDPGHEDILELILQDIDKRASAYLAKRARMAESVLKEVRKIEGITITKARQMSPRTDLLEDEEVLMAIASVVQAIDRHHTVNNPRARRGGFALAESTQVSLGITAGVDASWVSPVMRPRRCWLLPIVVAGSLHSEVEQYRSDRDPKYHGSKQQVKNARNQHTFLAVIQEESAPTAKNPHATEFRVYFLDSAAHHYADVRDFLYSKIRHLATNLTWSTHRNSDNHVRFSDSFWTVTVPRQTKQYACGLHTIVNAWILALGLMPETKAPFDEEKTYLDLRYQIKSALAGLVDWSTVYAYLRCKRLVRRDARVPAERRFKRANMQVDAFKLQDEIEEVVVGDDGPLGGLGEEEAPYDWGLNVDFGGWGTREVESEIMRGEVKGGEGTGEETTGEETTGEEEKGGSADVQETGDDASEASGLQRQYEEWTVMKYDEDMSEASLSD